jgi:hypothetical protein
MSGEDLHGTFWYCLHHHTAETWEEDDRTDRIGPFPTREAAAAALQTIAARERKYDSEDAAWNGDGH